MERQTLKEVCISILFRQKHHSELGVLFFSKLVDEGISEDEAWRLFLQIVDALSHMSTHTILHRDIKLTNIFIGIIPFSQPMIDKVADVC